MDRSARYTHRGSFSAWLIKAKSDGAKAKWFQTMGRRYFTIDFDKQIFFYKYSESTLQASTPIHFSQILGAAVGHSYDDEDDCDEEASSAPGLGLRSGLFSSKPRRRPNVATAIGVFPFTLRTMGKRMRLEAEVESEAFQWISMLNAASRIGRGVDILLAPEPLDETAPIPRAPTPDSLSGQEGKPPSETSEEASKASTAASSGDENSSETSGVPSPKAWSEAGGHEASQELGCEGEDAAAVVDDISCHFMPSGPCLRAYSGSFACSVASGSPRGEEASSGLGRPTGPLQAADFGFEEEDVASAGEEASAQSPTASPRAAEQGASLFHGSQGEATRARAEKETLMDASRVAADLLLLQRHQAKAAIRPQRRSRGDAQEDKDREARIAADLMLLQAEAAKRSWLLESSHRS